MDGTIVVKQLADNIWTFNESVEWNEPGATAPTRPQTDAYLITGTKRAAVIDTLQDETSLYAEVRKLTSLPIDVLISHGHRDHAGASTKDFQAAGCDIYLSKDDCPLLARSGMDTSTFKPLQEGMIFDLGGYKLECIMLPGHTPGSMVFLEAEKQHLYTGDAIRAGVFWMQIPGALSLKVLRKNLDKVWNRVKTMDRLMIHTGHRHQAPIQHNLDFLADTIFVTDKIINGDWVGEKREMSFPNGQVIKYLTVAHNYVKDYAYNPDNIG
jgi:glyoxylase-like metal-dependent hydrolase (beta-lactamase superfamily II)